MFLWGTCLFSLTLYINSSLILPCYIVNGQFSPFLKFHLPLTILFWDNGLKGQIQKKKNAKMMASKVTLKMPPFPIQMFFEMMVIIVGLWAWVVHVGLTLPKTH